MAEFEGFTTEEDDVREASELGRLCFDPCAEWAFEDFVEWSEGDGDGMGVGSAEVQTSSEAAEQISQTGVMLTLEKEVNTDQDWESAVRSVVEHGVTLAKQYEEMKKREDEEKAEHERLISSLERRREEGKREHGSLIEKINSLQVKLELNSSRMTRKNFLSKRQELSTEKGRLEQDCKRLTQELEATNKKLSTLTDDQEKLVWEREIAELQTEINQKRKQMEEATHLALQDEIAAVEMQREVIVSQVEDWIAEADRYLHALKQDPSQQYLLQRLKWEKNVAWARSVVGQIQNKFNENLQLLHQGQLLENLPKISTPALPHIPLLELSMSALHSFPQTMLYAHSEQSLPSVPITTSLPQPSSVLVPAPWTVPPISPPLPSATVPNFLPAMGNSHQPSTASQMPLTGTPVIMGVPSRAMPPPQAPAATTAQPSAHAPLLPANPAPAGKLDKFLDRLGVRFPQSTRQQIMTALQQIKTARGTMAGLSEEEISQQVAQRLAENEKLVLGPIGPPAGTRALLNPVTLPQPPPAQFQRPICGPNRPGVGQVFHTRPPRSAAPASRKLCLMCQNHVDASSQYALSCSHTLHKECIRVWLQTSKNNSCPFCPSK
ncbi:RING finger protein 214-like [Denticeps clupeoides]|uniref:RING-type domain-containing protein n=1 Tax=Denticeps clupeoides TaxID=299321 RepID=A0AAY4AR90_9TELE|nr:RING finger protein 214-like [Denticeps clupeoides]